MLQSGLQRQDGIAVDQDNDEIRDKEIVKLYYSILSDKKNQSLQDKNRELLATTFPTKERTRPKTPFYEIRESPIIRDRATPLSVKYVYLSQSKPHPIEPLKAWKGYNGNLYFQPIAINSWSGGYNSGSTTLPSTSHSTTKPQIHTRQRRTSWTDLALNHPAIRLEKETVMSRLSMTYPAEEDDTKDQERFGTLVLGPLPSKKSCSNKKPQLFKGSMVHQYKKWKNTKSNSTYGYRYTLKGTPSSAKSTLLIANKNARKQTA